MRITFLVAGADFGGGFRVIVTYARLLKQRGHDVTLVARPDRAPGLRETLRTLLGKGGGPRPARGGHAQGTGLDLRYIDRFRPIVAADVPDADVVVSTFWRTARWVDALPPSKGRKIALVQDYETWLAPAEEVDATLASPVPKIVVSGWLGSLLREKFGPQDVTVIPNAVDPAQFYAPPRARCAEPTFGFVYTSDLRKGADIVREAVGIARRSVPDIRIMSFGHGPASADVPLPERCDHNVAPTQDRLRAIYAGCDAWLFASRQEGFGLPILEAMACRTPVIATPAAAAPDIVPEGGGILLPSHDPQAMADAMLTFARMPNADWEARSEAAERRARAFSWEDAAEKFEATLERLVRAG